MYLFVKEGRIEMATNIAIGRDKGRIFDKICRKLGWGRGALGALKRRARWQADGTPVVVAGDQGTYPVETGDLAYDYTNDYAYICSVAPAASTAATFIKLHA